ncbi:hypothetical protein H6F61_21750 [Cyanobacteria bacterium FACHB-472]|nr:hypothetical protein [Cyanobacteria bacterium FACHB-472]
MRDRRSDRDYLLEQCTPEKFTEASVEPTVLFFSLQLMPCPCVSQKCAQGQ